MSDNNIHIPPSKRSPLVVFEDNRLFVVGRSIIEKPSEFYNPIFNWLKEFISQTGTKVTLYFAFEHINTSSTKWIYVIVKELCESKDFSDKIEIKWFYEEEDEDVEELGHVFSVLLQKEFDIVEITSGVFDLAKTGIVNLPL